jgi:hypothetical protein
MAKVILIMFFLVLQVNCYSDELSEDVDGYIELLTRTSEPTLAEYSKYAGECGGESELSFMQSECLNRYGEIFSCECVQFTRDMCENEQNTTSLELSWIRKNFATAGKKYDIIGTEHYNTTHDEGGKNITYSHKIISVKIGNNIFGFHRAENYDTPQGLSLYISTINGSALNISTPAFDMNETEKLKAYDFIRNVDEICKFEKNHY